MTNITLPRSVVEQSIETSEAALNGLRWYREAYPEADSQADDDMANQIETLLAQYRAALAAPQGEPVAWMADDGRVAHAKTKAGSMPRQTAESFHIPLYTTPQPAPTLEPLTLDQIAAIPKGQSVPDGTTWFEHVVRLVEAAHAAKLKGGA